jgi:hypothetical protein
MNAWLMILAIAVIGVVIGKLLYELNPSLWENAAARVEDDTPPDGATKQDANCGEKRWSLPSVLVSRFGRRLRAIIAA